MAQAGPRRPVLIIGLAAALAGCMAGAEAPGRASYGAFGIDVTARDLSVRPGDDFWSYANGGWARRTPFMPGVEALGVGVDLSRQADRNVQVLLVELASGRGAGISNAGALGAFYASWMDEVAVESRGLAPAEPWLLRIRSAGSRADVQLLLADAAIPGPIAFSVTPDPADPGRNLVTVGPGALGMPRDYFLLEGESYDRYRAAYLAYVTRLITLAGLVDPPARAAEVLALETAIAQSQGAVEVAGQPGQAGVFEMPGLEAAAPGYDWRAMFEAAGFPGPGRVVIEDGAGLAGLAGVLGRSPIPTWQDYLTFRFLSGNAPYLPRHFASAHADFYLATLGGGDARPDRALRGVSLAEERLGDAVGSAYADRYLSADVTRQVQAIITDVREAYRLRIQASPWMDDTTKAGALEKVAALRAEIGAPAPPDYSHLGLDRSDLFGNIQRITAFQRDRDRRSLSERHDAAEWPIVRPGPQGNYFPQANSIRLQAALLQPPYFDPNADAAVNYGAIGAFIGHEIGHAFDSQGSDYDARGRKRNWWTPSSRAEFERRVDALDAQYAHYEVAPGLPVNVQRTSGENLADLAGLEAAYAAYRIHRGRQGAAPLLVGLTDDQRFFMANAQMRRTLLQEDVARQLVSVGVHAPSRDRVNGVMRNMDAWYAAFGVGPGAVLYLPPPERIHIW